MSAPATTLEQILRALYGALGEDLSFRECLATAAQLMKSPLSALHREELSAHRAQLEIVGDIPQSEVEAAASEYSHRWAGQNLWIVRGASSLVSRGFGFGDEDVAEKELVESEYYRYYLRAFDVRYGMGMCLWHNGPGNIAVASFNRSAKAGPFSRAEMQLVRQLQPHMANAYRICQRATQLRKTEGSLRDAMDRAPLGMLVLSWAGKVLMANAAAEELLTSGMGITRNGRGDLVMANRPGLRQLLERMSRGADGSLSTTLIVTMPTQLVADGLVMHLHVLPEIAGYEDGKIVAFLCPMRRSSREQVGMLLLQSVLGLTQAEAKFVIALRNTYDLHAAASSLKIATSTAKTHLKHAFEKTSTHKQAELLFLTDRLLH